jgi:hypothetical protein
VPDTDVVYCQGCPALCQGPAFRIELAPDDALVLACRGDTFRLLGRYAEALADLTRAAELGPGHDPS